MSQAGCRLVNPAAKVPSNRVELQGSDIFIELP